MNKSKFSSLYQHLQDYGYDYDTITYAGGAYRIRIYKNSKNHLVTWKGPKEEHEHFIYLVRKYIYEQV